LLRLNGRVQTGGTSSRPIEEIQISAVGNVDDSPGLWTEPLKSLARETADAHQQIGAGKCFREPLLHQRFGQANVFLVDVATVTGDHQRNRDAVP
jgi:hypothetical protein